MGNVKHVNADFMFGNLALLRTSIYSEDMNLSDM